MILYVSYSGKSLKMETARVRARTSAGHHSVHELRKRMFHSPVLSSSYSWNPVARAIFSLSFIINAWWGTVSKALR